MQVKRRETQLQDGGPRQNIGPQREARALALHFQGCRGSPSRKEVIPVYEEQLRVGGVKSDGAACA